MNSSAQWVLFDPEKNQKSEVMSTEDMQFSLLKLKTKHIERFLIWSSHDENWRNLRVFLDSDQSPFMKTFLLIGQNRKKRQEESDEHTVKMSEVTETDKQTILSSYSTVELNETHIPNQSTSVGQKQFDGDNMNLNPEQIKIDFKSLQKNEKNNFKIEALLSTKKGHLFKTSFCNISMNQAESEKLVPSEFLNTEFDVLIINNFIPDPQLSRVKVKGTIIQSDTAQMVVFGFEKAETKQTLKSLLSYYLKKLNDRRSEAA